MERRVRQGGFLALASLSAVVISIAGAEASDSEPSEPSAVAAKKAKSSPLKLSPTERKALRNKLRKLNRVEQLEPRASALTPESFGGLWLDDHGKLVVAFIDQPAENLTLLRNSFPKGSRVSPGLLQPVLVDDSLKSLRALEAQMIGDRSGSLSTIGRFDLQLDLQSNSVVARFDQSFTDRDLETRRRIFEFRYGDRASDIVVERGPLAEPEDACTRTACPTLRAGLETEAPSGRCSTAFVVRGVTGKPTKVGDGILSAAHCVDPDQDVGVTRSNGGSVYGTVAKEKQEGSVDAEVHTVDQPGFSTTPQVFTPPNPGAPPIKIPYNQPVGSVSTYDGLVVGSLVCKSGVTTGVSCGEVLDKDYSPSYIPDSTGFIKASMCNEHGDSGGAVYTPFSYKPAGSKKAQTYSTAVGVLSGGGKETPCGDPKDYTIFSHIQRVKEALGVKVETLLGPM